MTNAWCHDIPRDEAVRASEDNRPGPLPTLEEAIAAITNHDAPPGARVSDRQCASPADTGANTELSRAGQSTPFEPSCGPKCTERDRVTERRPVPPGGGGNVTGSRTERVTLEVTHDLDAPLGDWIVQVLDESLGFDESVRVVDNTAERITQALTADRFASAVAEADTLRARVAELESAPAASGAAGTEVVLPECPFTPESTHTMGWWEAIGKVKKALAAAGVTVKEVGRE